MERNHNVQVGDIFSISSTDETGHSCGFVQVTKLKGKTMVEYSAILKECFVDETCDEALWECKVRPLRGAFRNLNEFFPAKVYQSTLDGKDYLRQPGKWGDFLFPYDEEKYNYRLSGYVGCYAREKMGTEK